MSENPSTILCPEILLDTFRAESDQSASYPAALWPAIPPDITARTRVRRSIDKAFDVLLAFGPQTESNQKTVTAKPSTIYPD